MNRTIKHHHPCQDCGTKTPCFGELEDNYDGEPPITCREFHLKDGLNADWICEYCQDVRETLKHCEDCGADIPKDGAALCATCLERVVS